ncbi:MAG TPA: hypothetical protein VN654_11105 [Vicinamibacterales bacterium]|nr:hypothetical protein [Vicinamibacterales bacterium]
MDEIFSASETYNECSIERCRELLGDEAIDLTMTMSIESVSVRIPSLST